MRICTCLFMDQLLTSEVHVHREVGPAGGRWQIVRQTPITLLGSNAASASPDDFDKAVEMRARDPSRQWQLDVFGKVCVDYLLVSDFLPSAYCNYILRFAHRELLPATTVGDMKRLLCIARRSSISRLVRQFLVSWWAPSFTMNWLRCHQRIWATRQFEKDCVCYVVCVRCSAHDVIRKRHCQDD